MRLNKVLFFYRTHHFVLAISAGLFSFSLSDKRRENLWLSFFIVLAVLLSYNAHNLFKARLGRQDDQAKIGLSASAIVCVLSLFGFGVFWQNFGFNDGAIFMILSLALSAISYSALRGRLSIRNIPYLKAIFVAIAWTMLCCFLPMFQDYQLNFKRLVFLLFFFSLALISDLRDKNVDSKALKTFPQVLSISVLLRLIYFLLGVFIFLNLCLFGWGFFISAVIASFVLLFYLRRFMLKENSLRTDWAIGAYGLSLLLLQLFTR